MLPLPSLGRAETSSLSRLRERAGVRGAPQAPFAFPGGFEERPHPSLPPLRGGRGSLETSAQRFDKTQARTIQPQRAAAGNAVRVPAPEQVLQQRRTEGTGEVVAALAPVQAGPAQRATR